MRYSTIFALVVAAFTTLLGGCYQEEIDKTRDEFAKQMKETRETLMAATRDFTTALPGGQYNLLIRDLNGDDKVAKEKAQAFLKSLGHLEDFDTKIEASVWFGFDPATSSSILVDAFRAPTLSIAEVKEHYGFKAGSLRPVGNTLSVPQSAEQLKKDIQSQADEIAKLLDLSSGLYPIHVNDMNQIGSASAVENNKKQNAAVRDSFKQHLQAALLAQYEQKLVPIAKSDIEPIRWSMLDPDQFLFVCIRQSDWQKHRTDPNVKIRLLLHEQGDPDKRFLNSDYFEIYPEEFDKAEPIDSYPSLGKVVCGVRNLTNRMLDMASLRQLQTVKETFAKWQEEINQKPNSK